MWWNMAHDVKSSRAYGAAPPTRDSTKLSEDISRVVSFLDTRRSSAGERTADLVQDLTQRRETLGRSLDEASPPIADGPMTRPQDQNKSEAIKNPELSVRYHSFCSELDQLLDTFRARVNNSKPVAH